MEVQRKELHLEERWSLEEGRQRETRESVKL